jgi:hypothetical protein
MHHQQTLATMRGADAFRIRAAARWATIGCLLVAAGCRPTVSSEPAGYFGPTQTMQEVVEAVNANNRQLPTLWTRGYFEAEIVDNNGRKQFVNGEATILRRKPDEFRLVGKKDVAGQIFELGATASEYWMIVRPEADTMWWGTFDALDRADVDLIPIRPDLLMEVLAIGEIDSNFLRDPMPVMRFNNDADAYMFVWHTAGSDRLIAQREIWFDRQTKQPRLVLLFDANGRIVLRAYLMNHKPIDGTSATIATEYKLLFPDRQTRLSLQLNDVKLTNNDVPREGSIRFPGPDGAGVSNVIRVDDAPPR